MGDNNLKFEEINKSLLFSVFILISNFLNTK